MAARRKTWSEKMAHPPAPEVQVIDKPFGGAPSGAKMLIATPIIVKAYIEEIPNGSTKTVPGMREDLAARYKADFTCPLTTGIFTRIAAESALDDLNGGKSVEDITPFWRIVDPTSPLAKKLSCGPAFIIERRAAER
jgi:hypothetical protein